MKKLILATNNRHKIAEITAILDGLDLKILSAPEFDDFPEIEETGDTLAENAMLKATAIWRNYSLPCLADDTGLEVDYLDGAPGIGSARFAGPGCSFDDNMRKLLGLLDGVPLENRKAVFRTVIAFVDNSGRGQTAEGTLQGYIGLEARGKFGFGYDPIFMVGGKSLAELTPEEKNGISHRGVALRGIRAVIEMSFRDL